MKSDRNVIVLAVMAATSSLNWIIIGPWTTGARGVPPHLFCYGTCTYDSVTPTHSCYEEASPPRENRGKRLQCRWRKSTAFPSSSPPEVSTHKPTERMLTTFDMIAGFIRNESSQLEVRCASLGLLDSQPRFPRRSHSRYGYLWSIRCWTLIALQPLPPYNTSNPEKRSFPLCRSCPNLSSNCKVSHPSLSHHFIRFVSVTCNVRHHGSTPYRLHKRACDENEVCRP